METENGKFDLAAVLRWLGGSAVLGSAAIYLMQGWHSLTSVEKYASFLGFSLVVFLLALVFEKLFKTTRSASALFGISLATVTVHFAQLGALTYAAIHGRASQLPNFFMYVEPTSMEVWFALASALVILLPLTFISARAIGFQKPAGFAAFYLLSNMLFLVPERTPWMMAALAALALIIAFSVARENVIQGQTPALKLAGLMSFAPATVLLGRTFLYPADELFYASAWAMVAMFAMWALPKFTESLTLKRLSQHFGLLPGFIACGYLQSYAMKHTGLVFHDFYMIDWLLGSSVLFCIGNYVMEKTEISTTLGGLALGFGLLMGMGMDLSTLQWALVMATGTVFIVFGFVEKCKFSALAGVACFVFGFLSVAVDAWRYFDVSPWLTTGVLGLMVLLGATLLERDREGKTRAKLKAFISRFEGSKNS